MIVDRLKDTLDGGFRGLYDEVVTCDIYKLKDLQFQPDVVFDIGANVGVFTRYARDLFPDALIVSVEPDPENYAHLRKFTSDENTIFLNCALGEGQVFHGTTAANGSGEVYLSSGLGYPDSDMRERATLRDGMEFSDVSAVPLPDLLSPYIKPNGKHLLKVDCEGAENIIWTHEPSLELLKTMDYIAMEVHFYANSASEIDEVRESTMAALQTLEATHDCLLDNVNFWAVKR